MTPGFLSGKSDEEPVLPSRVMTIWTDAIHHQKDQPAQRGFGGRILFYDDEDSEPIKIDGNLTVYVFSDEPGQQNNRPERKFVFPAEQLKKHYSSGSLGHSYSVWLPWDEVGGPSRQLSLITRFDGVNGGTVISEPARKLLPGRSPLPEASTEADLETVAGVARAGYISPIESRQPISRLDASVSTAPASDSGPVSLASFVATENRTNSSQVETIDLQQASQQNSRTTTYSVPASLGLRGGSVLPVRSDQRPALTGGIDSFPSTAPRQRSQFQEGMEMAVSGSSSGDVRVEQQSGATVYYGRPGANWEQLSLQDAVATAKGAQGSETGDEHELANPITDSQTLRANQLQSIRASRQQFRSEPWRFPVRTQAIDRQSASDVR